MTVDAPDWMNPAQQMLQAYQNVTGQIALLVGQTGLSAGVPVRIATGGPHAANAAWGPDPDVAYGLGGAYEILLSPVTPGNVFITDVTVQHIDALGTIVWTENFTVSNLNINGLSGGTVAGTGVLIRGNLHGQKLRLSGLAISQANMNTILGTAVFTVTGVNVTYYAQSYAIPESKPKVAPLISAGYLALMLNNVINFGATFAYGGLPGYSGKAWLAYRAAQTNSTLFPGISSFSVLSGTTQLYTIQPPVSVAQPLGPVPIMLDQLFHTLSFSNTGTVNGTMNASLVMENFI